MAPDYTVYEYVLDNVRSLFPRWYAVTSYDFGDLTTGTELESSRTANGIAISLGLAGRKPKVVPNPYRYDQDYTTVYMPNSAGEERPVVGEPGRRHHGLPPLGRPTPGVHEPADPGPDPRVHIVGRPGADHSPQRGRRPRPQLDQPPQQSWDLNNRNYQQIAAGVYYFSVEDKTTANDGNLQTGKFVVLESEFVELGRVSAAWSARQAGLDGNQVICLAQTRRRGKV